MSTGVKCHRSCIEAFECLKRYKKHRYILFHIEDDKEIKVLCQADRTETYHNFKDSLLKKMDEGEGCYAVYDYEAEGKLPTLIFVSWVPSTLDVKKRMIYAASKSVLKSSLIGIKHEVEANDVDEIEEEELRKKAS
ncbi:Cofilin-2, variant 2 [Schistosoma haematobium]|uniref:ADF-H domain-containing protein n=3 Tax=Schistosoma TaxID=6181 RepID=A0A183JCS2_9TREM|nr:Cofilin-2, variant 2 [Schistosoma haematobium]CAH8442782.1 unnamed protein product [Schistosoma margrebowiei]CAH8442852.1 unnamed protein product [Schistosoma curassoni]KAH9594292.1 Cofilin-2, variant 2 [Schistosoma haematobium]CAH8441879.1 unnamed protein product [Schistosoma haematobium]VDO61773.1 unnamed protein product [Schistosoma curassoni]